MRGSPIGCTISCRFAPESGSGSFPYQRQYHTKHKEHAGDGCVDAVDLSAPNGHFQLWIRAWTEFAVLPESELRVVFQSLMQRIQEGSGTTTDDVRLAVHLTYVLEARFGEDYESLVDSTNAHRAADELRTALSGHPLAYGEYLSVVPSMGTPSETMLLREDSQDRINPDLAFDDRRKIARVANGRA